MFLMEQTFASCSAFVEGYDMAYEGGLLVGFKEWLVVRLGFGSNLGWSPLVLNAAFPSAPVPEEQLAKGPEFERIAINALFDLLAEFDEIRSQHSGLEEIFSAYGRHMRKITGPRSKSK